MFNKELLVILVSALPISELRGGIPLGFYYGFGPLKTFLLAIIGNGIIILPLFFFLNFMTNFLRQFKIPNQFFNWLFKKTLAKKKLIDKYGPLGLMLFTAIPLPYTGAYSACCLAYLLGIKIKKAAFFIFLGVLIAGIIVLLTSLGVLKIISF